MKQKTNTPEKLTGSLQNTRYYLDIKKAGAFVGSAAVVAACITACEPSPNPTGEGTTTTTMSAADAERQTDIDTLESALELFSAENGYLPTLANINDASWREYYLLDVDLETLRDPMGENYYMFSVAATGGYSYQPSPEMCDNVNYRCTNFMLNAVLDTGNLYVAD